MDIDRLQILKDTLAILQVSLLEAPADKRSAIAGQIRATLADIDELGGVKKAPPAEEESNGLLDFQRALAERKSAPKAARKA